MVEAALLTATHPHGARTAHALLATAGNVHLHVAFRREPNARLLFELAEWAAQTVDRGPVVAALMRDALGVDGGFYHLARFELDEARLGCIATIGQLVALGAGVTAPERVTEAWLLETMPPHLGPAITPLFASGHDANASSLRALARRASSPFPPGTSYLFGAYLTFLHTYLARNLVDALPRVTERIREATRDNLSIQAGSAGRMRARLVEER